MPISENQALAAKREPRAVLLTLGRLPCSLDLARRLRQLGLAIHIADSIRNHLCRYSRFIEQAHVVPPPAENGEQYVRAIADLAREHRIDLIIPIGEEIFFLARYRRLLPKSVQLYCDQFEKLEALHNKCRFIDTCTSLGFRTPVTTLVSSRAELELAVRQHDTAVLKPVYSRFASKLYVLPGCEKPPEWIAPSSQNPWVAQEYVEGEVCSAFAVCSAGHIVDCVVYDTPYTTATLSQCRAGRRGAGVYFRRVERTAVDKWMHTFVAALAFTGAIGFDFILDPTGVPIAIECNPRQTSGIHLISDVSVLMKAAGFNQLSPEWTSTYNNLMLRCLMQGAMLDRMIHRPRDVPQIWRDMRTARDVILDPNDTVRTLHLVRLLGPLLCRWLIEGTNAIAIGLNGLCWDGEVLSPAIGEQESSHSAERTGRRSNPHTKQAGATQGAEPKADVE